MKVFNMVQFQYLILLLPVVCQVVVGNNDTINTERNGKVFSLFSVVQFKNTACKSQSTMSSGQSAVRNGTCFTSSECSSKGGTASGNCAAGFGVCCLFLVSSGSSIINNNCTYIRNPGFPSVYTTTSSLTYTINKCSSDVCFLRLDFETFTILSSTVDDATACTDKLVVTATNTGQSIPTICGKNTGQHIYVDIGNQATDSVTLAFTFGTTTSTARTWEIKVSQIPCSSLLRPPTGCLQYWSSLTGRISTFNFLSTTGFYLPNQQYTSCVRRAAGYCCIEYYPCADATNSFTVGNPDSVAAVDSNCGTLDYVSFPGADIGCSLAGTAAQSRFCGQFLGETGAQASASLCDCTPPFQVGFNFDAIASYLANMAPARGVCLDYKQLPCTTY